VTRDEILNMPAGREMDALVAEKVMGWSNVEKTTWSNYRADGTPFGGGKEWRGTPPNHEAEFNPVLYPIKNYSTDIAAAWMVVEKIRPLFWSTQVMVWDHSDKYIVSCVYRGGHDEPEKAINSEAPTAPLAICRAALLAVMDSE